MYVILLIITILFLILNSDQTIKELYQGKLTVASPIDHKRAIKYAMKKMCEEGKYKWIEGQSEFSYDCIHTKDTCLKESKYPTNKNNDSIYLEWREKDNPDAIYIKDKTGVSISNRFNQDSFNTQTKNEGVCILGNETYRQFCEKENLKYDKTTGKCSLTEAYCNKRCMAFCNGECKTNGKHLLFKNILGDTVSKALMCSRNVGLTQQLCKTLGPNVPSEISIGLVSYIPGFI